MMLIYMDEMLLRRYVQMLANARQQQIKQSLSPQTLCLVIAQVKRYTTINMRCIYLKVASFISQSEPRLNSAARKQLVLPSSAEFIKAEGDHQIQNLLPGSSDIRPFHGYIVNLTFDLHKIR